MNIPINLFMWVMAFLPIAVLLVLMIGFQWGATEAAPISLMITIITGIFFYKADVMLIAQESVKGIWSSFTILFIVWTAVLMYQVGVEAKAFGVIRSGMRKLLPNELLLVLAMGWIIESFLQGITGFGVPVAVGAPLLIGIGVAPLWAVILPLLGQSWGNTFGTLGAAWDALASCADLTPGSAEYLATAFWTAVFLWLWNFIIGLSICWFYGKGKAIKKGLPAIVIISAIQGGGELLLTSVNTTIACFVPAVAALLVIVLLGRSPLYAKPWSIPDSPIMNRGAGAAEESASEDHAQDMNLIQAFVPYILLTAITLIVLLVGPVNSFLGQFKLSLSFPETVTGYGYTNAASEAYMPISLFTHACMFLLISDLLGLLYYKKKGWIGEGGGKRIFLRSVTMAMPSSCAIVGLIIMSKIMAGTGQTTVLAGGISEVLGNTYAILAPLVGLLGSFMTGSNMSSNILFGGFQVTTANLLQINPSVILGAQSSGGSIGASISPSNIVLGTTTANILGSEGNVLKRIICITIPAAILVGLIVFALVTL